MRFTPSLELSRTLFEEQITPIMARDFPNMAYAAASLGMCSEIQGLDDAVSMDHEWGPRVTLFLSEADHEARGDAVDARLRASLPLEFAGYPMMWRARGVDVHDTSERILYHVSVRTVDSALRFCGGLAALPLRDVDWLRISEQHLLEFTSGIVYRDDEGELTEAREALRYYPDNVLRFLLAHEWYAINGAWFAIGRIGSRRDSLGLRLQAARAASHLMRAAFMVSRAYRHYQKWFGTLFMRLSISAELAPVLLALLEERDWQGVEERIAEAASILVREQNALGIAPEALLVTEPVDDGRHHLKGNYGDIGKGLAGFVQPPLREIMENQVGWLDEQSLILGNEEVGKWPLLLQR